MSQVVSQQVDFPFQASEQALPSPFAFWLQFELIRPSVPLPFSASFQALVSLYLKY
jgi:hypothetical protein